MTRNKSLDSDSLDTDPPKNKVYVGEIRYGYKLSVTTAEKMLSEIGGIFSSKFIELHRGEKYDQKKISEIVELFDAPTILDLVTRFDSSINEARQLSRDLYYAPIKAMNSFPPVEMLSWSIIDTCKVDMTQAVFYMEEICNYLQNETASLTRSAVKDITTRFARKGRVPPAICRQYRAAIYICGTDSKDGKKISAYLLAGQGVSNQEIAKKVGYEQSSITTHINAGRTLAKEKRLPPLEEYMPERTKRRKKRSKKKTIALPSD